MTPTAPKDVSNLSLPADTYERLADSDSPLAALAKQLPPRVVSPAEAPDMNQDATTAPPTTPHDHATQD